MRPIVLTFVGRYLPGYKSGGPVRTIANLVEHLGEELDFRIVTSDRDALDQAPYRGVAGDAWNRVGNAQVYYASRGAMTLRGVSRLLRETPHDVLYLNSFFDPMFTALPLLVRHLGVGIKRPVVLAPRGEFAKGALSLKPWKKRPYIVVMRALGLYRDLIWQASSKYEACDIQRVLGAHANRIEIAPNLPPKIVRNAIRAAEQRNGGVPLRVAFVARISPNKNLAFALKVLRNVRVPVEFDIVGPASDNKYWHKCEDLIAELPELIKVNVIGSMEHGLVSRFLAEKDLLFLPTKGENYGHVIAEALSAGTPVLISDRTLWCGLEKAGVGWDLPLDREQPFVAAIEAAAAKPPEEYAAWRQRAVSYASARLTDPSVVQATRRLFLDTYIRKTINDID